MMLNYYTYVAILHIPTICMGLIWVIHHIPFLEKLGNPMANHQMTAEASRCLSCAAAAFLSDSSSGRSMGIGGRSSTAGVEKWSLNGIPCIIIYCDVGEIFHFWDVLEIIIPCFFGCVGNEGKDQIDFGMEWPPSTLRSDLAVPIELGLAGDSPGRLELHKCHVSRPQSGHGNHVVLNMICC